MQRVGSRDAPHRHDGRNEAALAFPGGRSELPASRHFASRALNSRPGAVVGTELAARATRTEAVDSRRPRAHRIREARHTDLPAGLSRCRSVEAEALDEWRRPAGSLCPADAARDSGRGAAVEAECATWDGSLRIRRSRSSASERTTPAKLAGACPRQPIPCAGPPCRS